MKETVPGSRASVWVAAALIVLAGFAAYQGVFRAPFIFDDQASILDNRTLLHLSAAWFPPGGEGATVEGRPLLNASFALNYALSGDAVWSYHLFNLGIHLAAALTLLGIVRRTLVNVGWPAEDGLAVGFAVALIWALHPLQTESVTYVAQRAESLMGLFYLLTVYGLVRATTGWLALSWLCCLLGMATKEVIVTAPVIVLLYDRTFIAGSFRAAWRARHGYYLALGATWILLAVLVIGAGNRGGTIGSAAGVTPWQYLLCQSRAIVHYLRLAFWPAPLVFDYGSDFVAGLGQVWMQALLDLALLAATVFALWRRPALGFLGAWFFIILAPTSSFVGGARQMLAEHRMYLPLASVVSLVVAAGYALWGRRSLILAGAVALALGTATYRRNAGYCVPLVLYQDTIRQRPENPWAHTNYGLALGADGQTAEALQQFDQAIRLKPDLAEAHYDRGVLLAQQGKIGEAISAYRQALAARSGMSMAQRNLASLLLRAGRPGEAVEPARAYVRLRPDEAGGHLELGNALATAGAKDGAAAEFSRAAALGCDSAQDCYRLGLGFAALADWAQAQAQFERAVRIDPDLAEAHLDLGNCWMMVRRWPEAIGEYRRAIALRPGVAAAHYNLANALMQAGRTAEGTAEYQAARALKD